MTEQIELRPCPFCGSKANILENFEHEGIFVAVCENLDCQVSTPEKYGEAEAAKEWNTRPIEDALRAELAQRQSFPTCATCKARGMANCFAENTNVKPSDYCSRWEAKA